MINIVELIHIYLRENRRLVIPEVGAFVVKESGEIIFSELLKDDDGRLHDLLIANGLSEIEVAATIDRFIFELRHETRMHGYYRINPIGTLRLDPATQTLRLIEPPKEEEPKVVAEPVVAEVAEKPKAVAEPVVAEVAEKPKVVAEPVVAEVVEEPKAVAEPVVAEVAEEPTAATEPVVAEVAEKPKAVAEHRVTAVEQPAKRRHRADIIILAVVILIILGSLAIVGYGWFKTYYKDIPNDEAQMEALRDENFRTDANTEQQQ